VGLSYKAHIGTWNNTLFSFKTINEISGGGAKVVPHTQQKAIHI